MKIPKIGDEVVLNIPSRVHISLFNDQKIGLGKPGGGAIALAIDAFNTQISIKVIKGKNKYFGASGVLINHILDVFYNNTNLKGNINFKINVLGHNNKHLGFGSSVGIFLGILLSLNILYNYPLTNNQIRKLVGYNYVEYEGGHGLVPGYETGGGPACMLYGGLALLTDSLEIIDCISFNKKYKVLCFIPSEIYQGKNNRGRNSFSEKQVFDESKRFSEIIPATTNKVFYDLIPAIKNNDIVSIGNIVDDLNFMMGNLGTIKTRYSSSYFYLFEKIRELGGIITGLSSTGPTVYVVSTIKVLNSIVSKLHNDISMVSGIYNISKGISGNINNHPIKNIKFPNLQQF